MNVRNLKDVFDSIQFDGKEMDVENPQLKLCTGQVHTLRLAGKGSALWRGEGGPAGSGSTTSLTLEVKNERNEGTSDDFVEFYLTAERAVDNACLVLSQADSNEYVVLSVIVESSINRWSVTLPNGLQKSASEYGHLFVPSNSSSLIQMRLDKVVGVAHFPENRVYRYTYIGPGNSDTLAAMGEPISFGEESMTVGYTGGSVRLILEVYEPWATFGSGGVDHGPFLPIMMKVHELHKISIHPFDSEGGNTIGSFYGRSEWFDVLPEQGEEVSDVPRKSISVGRFSYEEIGGPGRPERYIRLKKDAPMGAIPLYFRFSGGSHSGGLVNVERYE
ncbi:MULTISPECIES: hypothetical protein [unclassified Pseudomonas]|uniref:hypothetical protein n=1 Tax=unclassified Pseudomonas TaxID=196821 RepID=UPI001CBFC02A|nr:MULTISPECIES: hypothetical protein [unclassified Pseudomonas]